MNTYLLPVVNDEYIPFIMKVVAKGYTDAQDKFIKKFYDDFEWDYADDWDDLLKQAEGRDWAIGEISDKDDF
jgi:hypothetical protein